MSYASDNDGSAFITKAEFDSLKNSFQSKLDEYNKWIDVKLTDAISAYLTGIKSIFSVVDTSNISELVYPLKLITRLNSITKVYPAAIKSDPIIRMGYKFFCADTNRLYHTDDFFEFNESSKNDTWVGGDWDSGSFYVTGVNSEPFLVLSGFGVADHFGNTTTTGADLGANSMFLDYKYAARTGSSVFNNSMQSKKRNSVDGGQALTLMDDGFVNGYINSTDFSTLNTAFVPLIGRADYKNSVNWPATESFDKWPSTSSGRIMFRRTPIDPMKYLKWTFTTTYTKGIKYIYNISDTDVTTNNKYFVAPSVAGGGKNLYLTNMKNSRVAYLNNAKSPNLVVHWDQYLKTSDTYRSNWGITGIITGGLNIESPYNAITGHTYSDNYGAVETSKLRYKFVAANGSTKSQDMVKGIPIYSFAEFYPTGLDEMEITLNIASETSTTATSNQKYICFSMKPISKSVFDGSGSDVAAIAANADLLPITSGGDGAVSGSSDKLYKLKEGSNKFRFKGTPTTVNSGDVLYAKIYFSDSEQFINLTEKPMIMYVHR